MINRRLAAALAIDPDTDRAATTVATVRPPAQVPEAYMQAALRIVDPALAEGAITDKHLREYRERAARGQVKRIVAALCGVDDGLPIPEYNAAYNATRLDSYVVLSRSTLTRLREALLTEPIITALEQNIGAGATAELLGTLSTVA